MRCDLVLLIDVNPAQARAFKLEQALAEDIVQQLRSNGLMFSLIVFGSQGSRQITSYADADKIVTLVRNLGSESTIPAASTPPKVYEALNMARSGLSSKGRNSIVVVSGGRDNLDGRHFKAISAGLESDKMVCHVAIVSSQPLYGTKGIQFRGYYLHDLAGKTRGEYLELGTKQNKVAAAASKLSQRILLESQAVPEHRN